MEPTITETIASIVTHPYMLSLLFTLGLVGLTIEFFAPGRGVGGVIGLLAFALYFYGHLVAGYASLMHIGLFLLGLLLLMLELVLPGGIVGGLGFVSLVGGLVLAAADTSQGLLSLGVAIAISAVVAYVLYRYFGMRGVWHKLVLTDQQHNEDGFVAVPNHRELIGKTGVALTPLRPAGVVQMNEKRIDAVSVGNYITQGTPVTVVQVEGARVVVQEQQDADWKE
ncbi:NfeD family protein [Brevibacillus dissolubilis]|uniref:NfeD family protein n=1 Tax=Brevibacillus dissolubilis TaxID=1844116 RepID=UPI0011161ED2|nr:NfeD family protein [Brevibacillus dissolubilis]